MSKNRTIGSACGLVAVVAIAWFAYRPLLARYYVQQLERAHDNEALAWTDRVAALGDAAMPRLLTLLRRDGPASGRAGRALLRIMDRLPDGDARSTEVAKELENSFRELSPDGKQAALEITETLLAKGVEKELCRAIVLAATKDSAGATREAAIPLAMRPDLALEPNVLPLLRAPEASVRRAALLAIGSSRELLTDDDLLPWLHDSDAEVRGLCETTLRARGLRERDIQLGRMLTDPSPLKRLQVLDFLPGDEQIDPHTWLFRLSQDPVPAVRAGAVRAGMDSEQRLANNFSQRVQQMADSDPDGTVRQIAADLLRERRR